MVTYLAADFKGSSLQSTIVLIFLIQVALQINFVCPEVCCLLCSVHLRKYFLCIVVYHHCCLSFKLAFQVGCCSWSLVLWCEFNSLAALWQLFGSLKLDFQERIFFHKFIYRPDTVQFMMANNLQVQFRRQKIVQNLCGMLGEHYTDYNMYCGFMKRVGKIINFDNSSSIWTVLIHLKIHPFV